MEDTTVRYADFVRQNPWSSRHFYDWARCSTGRVLVVDLLDVASEVKDEVNRRALRKDAANRIVMAAASRAKAARLDVSTISRKPWHSVFLRFDPK